MRLSILLASALALLNYAYFRGQRQVVTTETKLNHAMTTQQFARQAISDYHDLSRWQLEHELDKEYKAQYRPILDLVNTLVADLEQVEMEGEAYRKCSRENRPADATKWLDLVVRNGIRAEVLLEQLLKEFGEELGLNSSNQRKILAELRPGIREVSSNITSLRCEDYPQPLDTIFVASTELRMATILSKVNRTILSVVGSKRLSCFFTLFSVYPAYVGEKSGDPVVVLFVANVGSYNDDYRHIKVTVNGKPYEVDDLGVLCYRGYRRKDDKLLLEYTVTNPLTGETYGGTQEYWLTDLP